MSYRDLVAMVGERGIAMAYTTIFTWSRKRDVNAAKAFLRKPVKEQRIPTKITLDAYAAFPSCRS